MVFGAKCCCSHHNTWHHGEVSPKLLRAVNAKELAFCDVARAKNKNRSRWVCPPCRDRIALELKCQMYEEANCNQGASASNDPMLGIEVGGDELVLEELGQQAMEEDREDVRLPVSVGQGYDLIGHDCEDQLAGVFQMLCTSQQTRCHTIVTTGRTMLFIVNGDGSCMIVDSHKHINHGAVIAYCPPMSSNVIKVSCEMATGYVTNNMAVQFESLFCNTNFLCQFIVKRKTF